MKHTFLTSLHTYGGREHDAAGKDKHGKTIINRVRSTDFSNDTHSSEFLHMVDLSHFAERVRTNPEYRKSKAERIALKKVKFKGINKQ